jgi:hypothetical protein
MGGFAPRYLGGMSRRSSDNPTAVTILRLPAKRSYWIRCRESASQDATRVWIILVSRIDSQGARNAASKSGTGLTAGAQLAPDMRKD